MSYLNSFRLHFAGRFQADVSTVNNDPTHFDNATFKPNYQLPGSGATNGWWNPDGTGSWRLVDCQVTAAHYQDGTPPATDSQADPVVGLYVAGSDDHTAAKLVDLDPAQQGCSEIWGMQVRLTDGSSNFLKSNYKVAAFSDLWARAPRTSGDQNLAAFYQSVLTDLMWQLDNLDSKWLSDLQALNVKTLSIKFNVDGYKLDSSDNKFTTGRIVGTIGPAFEAEPKHFILGRQLMPALQGGNPTVPENDIFFTPAQLDTKTNKLIVDFGNSLPTEVPGGKLKDLGTLHLAVLTGPNNIVHLGEIEYQTDNFYEQAAAIQAFPADRPLSEEEATALAANPLVILGTDSNTKNLTVLVQESIDGLYVRADEFVFRMDPNQKQPVTFWASRYGNPAAHEELTLSYDNSMIGGGPTVGIPTAALRFPSSAKTDSNGRAQIDLESSDPKNPRGYIDGQVYGVGYRLASITTYNPDPWNVLSVLVWNHFVPDSPISWEGSLQPIMQQYANLYPRMKQVLDLSKKDDVLRHKNIMQLAFGLPPEDPNYMPATRDLSNSKKAALLKWLAATQAPVASSSAVREPAPEVSSSSDSPRADETETRPTTKQRHRSECHIVGKTISSDQLNA